MESIIYFDNAATTKVDEEVFLAMKPYYDNFYGNSSSLHSAGIKSAIALEKTREIVAKQIGAKATEIYFTSGATEANNLAIQGIAHAKKKGHIITSAFEHPSVFRCLEKLNEQGFDVTFLPIQQNGKIKISSIEKALTSHTILVSVMAVNNEIGSIQPLEKIGMCCRQHNILFHTDAVQAFTRIAIDVQKMNIDLLSLSAHKLHGPTGVGCLFVREGIELEPLFWGGSQEKGLRPGTANVAGIVGLGKAISQKMPAENELIREIKNYFLKLLNSKNFQVQHIGELDNAVSHILSVSFKNQDAKKITHLLQKKGILVSRGAACSSNDSKPSRTLCSMGFTEKESQEVIRFSFSKYSTRNEVDYTIKILGEILE